jgi:CPA2 family monovalent cation:H+ antiporter-2
VDVRIVSLRRSGGQVMSVNPDLPIQEGDTLVLSGKIEALTLAEQRLLRG